MIPSILADQLQQGVADFLRATYPSSTPHFHGMLDRFLDEDGTLFKGPYLSLKLPFEGSEHGADYFPDVPLDFPPYAHQAGAFERLAPPAFKSTLVATGTGSGKTEAFLWPILEHVCETKDENGVKAILIYPMNALANDQAGRIAEAVDSIDALEGVRVGLYVGQQSEQDGTMTMGSDHVIMDREALRLAPPDILMTNYKMLDYLLTRPRDKKLWAQNDPKTLRYLVVDELHTFDGAQGTDLACLIRRLKSRLETPANHLCCVGTSATLGGPDDEQELRNYAEDVFSEPFDDGSVIGEERKGTDTFLRDIEYTRVPSAEEAAAIRSDARSTPDAFLATQHRYWFGDEPTDVNDLNWRLLLRKKLRRHAAFHHLLSVAVGKPTPLSEVADALARKDERLAYDGRETRQAALSGLLALVSWARDTVPNRDGEEVVTSLGDVRQQLWLREMRRMVASVDHERPTLAYSDDLEEEQRRSHLPVVHCLDCGAMGWLGIRRRTEVHLRTELSEIYRAFFNRDSSFDFCFPVDEVSDVEAAGNRHRLCTHDLVLNDVDADSCNHCTSKDALMTVFVPDNTRTNNKNKTVGDRHCPRPAGLHSLQIALLLPSRRSRLEQFGRAFHEQIPSVQSLARGKGRFMGDHKGVMRWPTG